MIIILESEEIALATRIASYFVDSDFPSDGWEISPALKKALIAVIIARFKLIVVDDYFTIDETNPLLEVPDITEAIDTAFKQPMFDFLMESTVERVDVFNKYGCIAFHCK